MKKHLAVTAVLLFAAAPAVHADETGLAAIHDMGNESGHRLCMTSHYHYGSGSGHNRKEAEAAARQSWISFTAFEYGSDWGSYALSSGKSMECSQAGAGWNCSTSARPCRQAVRGRGSSRAAKR